MADFDPIATPVDYFSLGGQRAPGLSHIEGASSPRKWDERAGYGLAGSFPVYYGRRLAKFKGIIRLIDSTDWAAWYAWKPIVDRAPNGKRPRALDIWHPWLESLDIKSADVEDVSQPDADETGVYTITIEFIEHRAPKISIAKPEAAAPAEQDDPVEQKVAALTNQFEHT